MIGGGDSGGERVDNFVLANGYNRRINVGGDPNNNANDASGDNQNRDERDEEWCKLCCEMNPEFYKPRDLCVRLRDLFKLLDKSSER